MNIYILTEGDQTEMKLYPKWLSYIVPELVQIESFNKATKNSYYIFSGGGIPSIYNHAVNAIKDINSIGTYDYLIIALDAEELSPIRRKEKLLEHLAKESIELNKNCKLEIIIHNKCIETWFLGNRKVYKRNPQGERFKIYSKFYNVETSDPELMGKMDDFYLTAHFHESYLREMLKEHNLRYRKSRPNAVLEKHYFDELLSRVEDIPEHLQSFSKSIELLRKIKSEIL